MGPSWLTVKEAADRAGVSDSYMRRLLARGTVNGVQRGLQWMIDPASLRQYIEGRTRKPGRKKKT